ncbi:hypothetical protein H8E88_07030, partial [candidate division KSB1 bacterium]|nr:hypothetical protein [candidate division KSB1 bacterium]
MTGRFQPDWVAGLSRNMQMFEILFSFSKTGAEWHVNWAKGMLKDFKKQLGEKEFQKITANVLDRILQHGVTWGKQRVVSAGEAEGIWEEFNK